jgi:thiol-disulfide isomerase/thioredoxin
MRKSNYVGLAAILSLILTASSFMGFPPHTGSEVESVGIDSINLDGSTLPDEEIKADRLIVVSDKSYCIPCRVLEPTLTKLKDEGYRITIVKPENAPFPVSTIPTIIYYREEHLLRQTTGLKTDKFLRSSLILPLE